VVFAAPVNLVAHLGGRKAVVALHVLRMHALALQLAFGQPVVEGNVGSVADELVVKAVDALAVGAVLAEHLGRPHLVLGVRRGAVQTLASRAVGANGFVLLDLFAALGSHRWFFLL
jgi:hypothetical protein